MKHLKCLAKFIDLKKKSNSRKIILKYYKSELYKNFIFSLSKKKFSLFSVFEKDSKITIQHMMRKFLKQIFWRQDLSRL